MVHFFRRIGERPGKCLHTLSEAKFLLLLLFLANHFNISVFPHTLPEFDGTTANIFPWTKRVKPWQKLSSLKVVLNLGKETDE